MLVTGSDIFLFSPDGIINAATVTSAPALEGPNATPIAPTTSDEVLNGEPVQEQGVPKVEEEEAETEEDDAEKEKETADEVKAFMKWANKGKRARLFEFKSLDPIVGEALNRCAFDGDLDTARALAKAYLT
jgi:hypothetical protein